jgi:hypothetical protein
LSFSAHPQHPNPHSRVKNGQQKIQNLKSSEKSFTPKSFTSPQPQSFPCQSIPLSFSAHPQHPNPHSRVKSGQQKFQNLKSSEKSFTPKSFTSPQPPSFLCQSIPLSFSAHQQQPTSDSLVKNGR